MREAPDAARARHRGLELLVDRDVLVDHLRVGPGVEVKLPLERGGDVLASHHALAHDLPLPRGLERAQVDHRRGRARQFAPVDDQVGPAAQRLGDVGQPPGVGATGEVGAGLQHRPGHALQQRARRARAARTSTGPRHRPAGSGRSGLGSSTVTGPGSSRPRAARVRSPSSVRAASARSRSKNITADGLSSRRRLRRYSRSTATRLWTSQASPYTVSAGNTATPPTLMQRSKPSAWAPRCAHAVPTTTRSRPARSCRTPTAANPASHSSRGHRHRLLGPDLERHQPDGARHPRHEPANHLQSVGPGEQRARRLIARDLGRQLRPVRDVGQVGQHRIRGRPSSSRSATVNDTSNPRRSALARATVQRIGAHVDAAHVAGPGARP